MARGNIFDMAARQPLVAGAIVAVAAVVVLLGWVFDVSLWQVFP